MTFTGARGDGEERVINKMNRAKLMSYSILDVLA